MSLLLNIALVFASSSAVAADVPSNISEKIFTWLAEAQGLKTPHKAPLTVIAKNVVCTRGSAQKGTPQCEADFEVKGKNKRVKIENSKLFFEYLQVKSAIALDEMAIGATIYKVNSLTCDYNLNSNNYYKCVSELTAKF